jgi:hypothetical protein
VAAPLTRFWVAAPHARARWWVTVPHVLGGCTSYKGTLEGDCTLFKGTFPVRPMDMILSCYAILQSFPAVLLLLLLLCLSSGSCPAFVHVLCCAHVFMCCAVLCCAVLCCAVLCCAVRIHVVAVRSAMAGLTMAPLLHSCKWAIGHVRLGSLSS